MAKRPNNTTGASQRSLFPAGQAWQRGLRPDEAGKPSVYTIGHSTPPLEELAAALKAYGIERVADIRHFPSSRHNPQFNQGTLHERLASQDIEYRWLKELGGYRSGGYLAYMETPDFGLGIEMLEQLAREKRTAYLCAELKWYQCHRRRVSDVMDHRGWQVFHIFDERRWEPHREKTNRIKCD